MANFETITSGGTRRADNYGSGQFGASRGGRSHHGLDIVAKPGEAVMSPIDGEVRREALPYPNDPRYRGVVIRGTGQWAGYEVKMFYVEGLFSGNVKAGQRVGTAQNLQNRYPGITNHVHLEVRHKGTIVPPNEMFGMCF